jgi:hypothetical protein
MGMRGGEETHRTKLMGDNGCLWRHSAYNEGSVSLCSAYNEGSHTHHSAYNEGSGQPNRSRIAALKELRRTTRGIRAADGLAGQT